MRTLLLGFIVCGLLAGGGIRLHAQTNTNIAPSHPQKTLESRMISFLTPAEQEKYAQVRAKVLADNLELKTEGENLIHEGETTMAEGTAADRQAFIEKMNAHREKLRQAMLKEDASLAPIFAKIDKQISEMKTKAKALLRQLKQSESSTSATNAPPTNPSTGP